MESISEPMIPSAILHGLPTNAALLLHNLWDQRLVFLLLLTWPMPLNLVSFLDDPSKQKRMVIKQGLEGYESKVQYYLF